MFIEIPASKSSISKRKLSYGVGINDADYITCRKIKGKWLRCPFYQRWRNMLERCYSTKFHNHHPTYKDCSVCEEWLTFSNFKAWMIKQDWKNKHLDKDLLIRGNKTYSTSACLFIPPQINTFLTNCETPISEHPKGVYLDKRRGKFQANCKTITGRKFLGYFDSSVRS